MSKKTFNPSPVHHSGKPPLPVQVTTDANIPAHEDLIQHVETEARGMLARFADEIMSVGIHFKDENGAKPGNADKRCLIEARCAGRPAVAVSDEGSTVEGAFHGALKKLQRMLEKSFGRTKGHEGRDTICEESPAELDEVNPLRL